MLERLGEGGFGVVYRAEQLHPVRRIVAVKVIKPGMATEEVIRRFEAERQALALMDHPHIAKVFDAGETDDQRPWFAMELVDGAPLTEYCHARQMPLASRLVLFIKVCSAVQHAHQKAVLHRDLKPSNILVTEVDGQPAPKVIDFGIAKALAQPLTDHTLQTTSGLLVGTPHYMSPEQTGTVEDVDTRSDIYSLGVVLYELLTGRLPLDLQKLRRAHADEICRLIREEEPLRPSTMIAHVRGGTGPSPAVFGMDSTQRWRRALRGELDWVIMRCLEKERERRYPSVGALMADLECHLKDEPVSARPPSASYRIGKLMRRNRAAVAAVAAVMFVLTVATIISMWQLHVTRLARSEAERERGRATRESLQRRNLLREASRSDVARATQLLLESTPLNNKAAEGLVHLRRAMLFDDANTEAAELAAQSILWHPDIAPRRRLIAELPHDGKLSIALFSPDGQRLLTADGSTVKVWETSNTTQPVRTLPHQGMIRVASFNTDGTRFVTGTDEGTAQVWETSSGSPVGKPLRHHAAVHAVAFRQDGLVVATGSDDRTARLWEVATGNPAGAPMQHEGFVLSLAFHPDGRSLMTGSHDGKIRFWDADTGEPTHEGYAVRGPVHLTRFIGGGRGFMAWAGGGTDRIVSHMLGGPLDDETSGRSATPSIERVPQAVARHEFTTELPVLALALSPNGRHFAISSPDHTIVLWDAMTGERTGTVRSPLPCHAIAFSPDGHWLAAADEQGAVRIWVAMTGEIVGTALLHGSPVTGVAFSPDGRRLMTGSNDSARLWQIPMANPQGRVFHGHPHFTEVALSEDGSSLVWHNGTGHGRVWDLHTGLPLGEPFDVFTDFFASGQGMPLTPDGRRMLHVKRNRATLYDLVRGTFHDTSITHGDDLITLAVFSREAKQFCTVSKDFSVRVWDTKTCAPVSDPLLHDDRVTAVSFTADGSSLVTACADHTARVWVVGTGALRFVPLQHGGTIHSVACSHDREWLVTGGSDRMARVWSLKTGSQVGEPVPHTADVVNVEIDHLSTRIATVTQPGSQVHVWDISAWTQPSSPEHRPASAKLVTRKTLPGGAAMVALWPDGRWLLTDRGDSAASLVTEEKAQVVSSRPVESRRSMLWHLPSGRFFAPFLFRPEPLHADFSPDGRWLATVTTDGAVMVREVVPRWEGGNEAFASFLALVADRVLTAEHELRPLTPNEREDLAAQMQSHISGKTGYPAQLMRWWLQEPRTRTLSPADVTTVPQRIEQAITAHATSPTIMEEVFRLDPLHPLVHLALAPHEPENGDLLRQHAIRHRLPAPDNEALYGLETLARYARTAARMLAAQRAPGNNAAGLAIEALELARSLEPHHADLPDIEAMLRSEAPARRE